MENKFWWNNVGGKNIKKTLKTILAHLYILQGGLIGITFYLSVRPSVRLDLTEM